MARDVSPPEVTSMDGSPIPTQKVRAEVILVHGTWAAARRRLILRRRRTYWYESDHQFRTRLEDRLAERGVESRIEAFTWSGKNSVRERSYASGELAAVISSRFNSGVPSLSLVAHSHGGNVALKAVDRLVNSPTEQSFDPTKLQIITLATPFLQVVDYPLRNQPLSVIDRALAAVQLAALDRIQGSGSLGPAAPASASRLRGE
jgi:hypothetical protein